MKKLILRGVFVTAFVFLTMWGIKGITQFQLFSAFDPISQALGEFELTDYVFSKFRPDPVPDPRIVLVNLGPDRATIAQQISIISKHKPKVIGIDSYFHCEGGFYDPVNCPQLLDTLGNLMLSNSIQEAGNVVLVTRLLQSDSLYHSGIVDVYDSIEYSDPRFSSYAHNAYANLVTGATYQEDVKVCKSFIPKMIVNGEEKIAFSVTLAMMYDSIKALKFLARNKEEEIINFRGNINISDVRLKSYREKMVNVSEFNSLCYAIDYAPFMRQEYEAEMFRNSIVMMGSFGAYFGDPAWEDKFFTPLNTKVAGRANPDMFGVVVHANIVTMILNEDFITEIPAWLRVIIAVGVCFANVLLFYQIDKRFPYLYDGLSVILQVIEIVIVSSLIVYFFSAFSIKLELSLTIGALALIGPCYDIYKSIENTIGRRKTDVKEPVPESENVEMS
jgi:CHASE2 domain-containing sensor protein